MACASGCSDTLLPRWLTLVHLFGRIQHGCRLFECPRLGAGLLVKDTRVLLEAPKECLDWKFEPIKRTTPGGLP